MNYNCDKCGIKMEIDGDLKTDYAGIECTMAQYIELTKDNPNVLICCDPCINKMPDAWPFFEAGLVEQRLVPEKNN